MQIQLKYKKRGNRFLNGKDNGEYHLFLNNGFKSSFACPRTSPQKRIWFKNGKKYKRISQN